MTALAFIVYIVVGIFLYEILLRDTFRAFMLKYFGDNGYGPGNDYDR